MAASSSTAPCTVCCVPIVSECNAPRGVSTASLRHSGSARHRAHPRHHLAKVRTLPACEQACPEQASEKLELPGREQGKDDGRADHFPSRNPKPEPGEDAERSPDRDPGQHFHQTAAAIAATHGLLE